MLYNFTNPNDTAIVSKTEEAAALGNQTWVSFYQQAEGAVAMAFALSVRARLKINVAGGSLESTSRYHVANTSPRRQSADGRINGIRPY